LDLSLLLTHPAQAAALAAVLALASAAADTEGLGLQNWVWADPSKQWAQGATGEAHAQSLSQAADQT